MMVVVMHFWCHDLQYVHPLQCQLLLNRFLFVAFQAQCILGIVQHIKENPRASQDDLAKEIQKRVELFKNQVDTL